MNTAKILVKRIAQQSCLCIRMMKTEPGIPRRPLQTPRTKSDVPQIKEKLLYEGGLILLVIPVTTFCLGIWQVKRRKRKLEIIDHLEDKTVSDPVPLPSQLDDIYDLEYQSVKVRGTFEHEKSIFMGPRSNMTNLKTSPGGHSGSMISGPKIMGGYIITPFKLADREATIIVNRGWCSNKDREHYMKAGIEPSGETDLIGVVRKSERRTTFTPKNKPERDQWHHRDVDLMAERLGAVPVFLDASIKSTIHNGPIGGQTFVNVSNDHASYIFTWFSLSAITGWLWYRRFIRSTSSNKLVMELYQQRKTF